MSRKEGTPRRFRSLPQPDLWREFDRQEAQREFERNPLDLPSVGDKIYVPDPLLSIMRKTRTGGRAVVERVLIGNLGLSEGPVELIRVIQDPQTYYEWYGRRGIGWQQGLLKEQFGDTWAGKKNKPA